MFNVIIFGPPGSGKGTQSAKIIEKYKLKHLSTGDLLRIEKDSGSELGAEIARLIDNGNMVSDEMAQKMVEAFVKRNHTKGYVFDGFPRTAKQAAWLQIMLQEMNADTNVLLSLEVEQEELKKRLIERGIATGRDDDKSRAIVETRLNIYHKQTEPVIEFYKQLGKYVRIDGMGSLNDVFERICEVIDSKKEN